MCWRVSKCILMSHRQRFTKLRSKWCDWIFISKWKLKLRSYVPFDCFLFLKANMTAIIWTALKVTLESKWFWVPHDCMIIWYDSIKSKRTKSISSIVQCVTFRVFDEETVISSGWILDCSVFNFFSLLSLPVNYSSLCTQIWISFPPSSFSSFFWGCQRSP